MNSVDLSRAFKLLFENFWIPKKSQPEEYMFLRRHQFFLQKELRERFGMNLLIRNHYIQLLKRPPVLFSWMGEIGFNMRLDYILFCYGMAYIEGMDPDKAFMLDELIRDIDLMKSEDVYLDWTNYNHRKSLVRIIKKMIDFGVIEVIQGETEEFGSSENNQEVLFVTTSLSRAFLSRAPQSYTGYQSFYDYWDDLEINQKAEGNQLIFQQLMLTPIITRTSENEELFIRLRNYHHHMVPYFSEKTLYHFELYQDYVALTLEERDSGQEIFPSRKVVDDILIQLATICRENVTTYSPYGLVSFSLEDWSTLLKRLKQRYSSYWSKEFSEMSLKRLEEAVINRGTEWELFEKKDEQIIIYPVFSRLVAEMRNDDE